MAIFVMVPVYQGLRTQVVQQLGKAEDFVCDSLEIHPVLMSGIPSLSYVRHLSYVARRNGVSFCRTYIVLLDARLRFNRGRNMILRRVVQLQHISAGLRPLVLVVHIHCLGLRKSETGITTVWTAAWQSWFKAFGSRGSSIVGVSSIPVCVVVAWIISCISSSALFSVR